MRGFGWVLAGLIGWSAVGGLGTVLAILTADYGRAGRSLGWIFGVWVAYLAALFAVSAGQQQQILPPGQEECFQTMCFSVIDASSVPEFKGEGGGRLMQVAVQVRNAGDTTMRVDGLQAYLVSADGRRWAQTPGLGGVPLTVRLPGFATTRSVPVFRLDGGASGFGLVLTRKHTGWNWLVIGDTDSPAHRQTVLRLP